MKRIMNAMNTPNAKILMVVTFVHAPPSAMKMVKIAKAGIHES